MNYSEYMASARRLRILKILKDIQGYRANELVLGDLVDAYGYSISHDQLRTDMAWLAEQGLITIDDIADIRIAGLTQRGADVAAGKITTPGVDRPAPEQ